MVAIDVFSADLAGRTKASAGRSVRACVALIAAGLYGVGWLLAKAVQLVLLVLSGVLYGVGWTARRMVWTGLVWSATAVRVGWDDGRKRADAVPG